MLTILAALAMSGDVLDRVEGVWELDPQFTEDRGTFTCDQEPLEIVVDAERRRYMVSHGEYAVAADILRAENDAILIRYDGEQRLDDAGKPVEWFLVLLNDDQSFAWVRRDWRDERTGEVRGATPLRRRCPQPPVPTS